MAMMHKERVGYPLILCFSGLFMWGVFLFQRHRGIDYGLAAGTLGALAALFWYELSLAWAAAAASYLGFLAWLAALMIPIYLAQTSTPYESEEDWRRERERRKREEPRRFTPRRGRY